MVAVEKLDGEGHMRCQFLLDEVGARGRGLQEPVRHVLDSCPLVLEVVDEDLFTVCDRSLGHECHSTVHVARAGLKLALLDRFLPVLDVGDVAAVARGEEGVGKVKVY